MHVDYQGIIMTTTSHQESQFANLSFTYNFGNKNIKASKDKKSAIQSDEERLKNQ